MKGINYIVDEEGRRQSAVIDLNEWGEEWEDIEDTLVTLSRIDEDVIPLEEVTAKLKKTRHSEN